MQSSHSSTERAPVLPPGPAIYSASLVHLTFTKLFNPEQVAAT